MKDHKKYQVVIHGRYLDALVYCIRRTRMTTYSAKFKRDMTAVEKQLRSLNPTKSPWEFPIRQTRAGNNGKYR